MVMTDEENLLASICVFKSMGDDTKIEWNKRKFYRDTATDLMELQDRRKDVAQFRELLESTKAQCNRLQEENRRLKEKNAALADVIADLKMDIKARE